MEYSLLAIGRKRYADLFGEEDEETARLSLIDGHSLMVEAKHFKNLHLQESRLRRQYRQDLQELRASQAECKEAEKKKKDSQNTAAPIVHAAAATGGFEFTSANQLGQTNCEPLNLQSDKALLSNGQSS